MNDQKGWIRFVYEGHGEHVFLEVYSPAVHETVVVGRIPEAAAATTHA